MTTEYPEYDDYDDEETIEPEVTTPIEVKVKRTVNVAITGKKVVGERTILVNSLKSGIRVTIKRNGYGSYHDEKLLIPNELVDTVGEVFTAIREAKQKEEEANG